MANKRLFGSGNGSVKPTNTTNYEGAPAYKMSDKHALAQIACTNCFRGTFYASGDQNLKVAKDAVEALKSDPNFLAKVAVYSRSKGYMKDMPAYLVTWLNTIDTSLFGRVFPKVIDNGKMLRNFVQMGRSGQCGRVLNMTSRSIQNAVTNWFNNKPSWVIFKAAIGNNPTMRDMLRMVRPKPNSKEKAALFAYLCGAEFDVETGTFRVYKGKGDQKHVAYEHHFTDLPQIVQEYENYRATHEGDLPKVDFRYLDSLGLGTKEWTEIAKNAPWMMTRMNLNTFARHGVFNDSGITNIVANRLRDKEAIHKARQFPYQIYTAWKAVESNSNIPFEIREALQDAIDIALDNVPALPGKVHVCVDTSGSMGSPVTGVDEWSSRRQNQTIIRCTDVAGLIASAVLRANRSANIMTFRESAVSVALNPRDTIVTNTQKLATAGGGTNCSSGLAKLNQEKQDGDVVIYVSDYESWLDGQYANAYANIRWGGRRGYGVGTGMQNEWSIYKKRNKKAKLICIDLTPKPTAQITEHKDVLQVGGFSDAVFDVIASFAEHGSNSSNHWVSEIEKIEF